MERKFIGVYVPTDLNDWIKEQGIKQFGRKNSKSDFIRLLLMQKHDEWKVNNTLS